MSYERQFIGGEVVSLAEAKAHLNVDFNDDDALILALIDAARDWAETHTETAIRYQEVTAYFRTLTARNPLPLGNAKAIISVTVDGNAVDSGKYRLLVGAPSVLSFSEDAPTGTNNPDSVIVTYTAGFEVTDSPAENLCPIRYRQGILLLVGDMYENRESKVDSRISENPTLERLLFPKRELGL